jgi:hypothetical protein
MSQRLKLLLAIIAPTGLVAVVLGAITLRSLAADRALEASWRQRLGGQSFLERFPQTEDNETALELERLGTGIGLPMAPSDEPGRPQPTPDDAAAFAAIEESLAIVFEDARATLDGAPPPVPEDLRAFLDTARPTLDRIVARVVVGPLPVWRSNLAAGRARPLPSYTGVQAVTDLLLAEALVSFEAAQNQRGERLLDSSWRLTMGVVERPELFSQLTAEDMMKHEIVILRARPQVAEPWPTRLNGLDLSSRRILAIEGEAFASYQEGHSSESTKGRRESPLGRWFQRDWARRCHRMVEEAQAIPIQDFHPVAFVGPQIDKLPRWNLEALRLVTELWDPWPGGAHVDLAAELTVLADRERQRLATGDSGAPSPRQPSRFPGLGWLYEPISDGTRIRLDGTFRFPRRSPLALEAVVRRATGPVDAVASRSN